MNFKKGERVRIIEKEHFPRYVGLIGKIVWLNKLGEMLQIETETKPPYYRPATPPWIVTVRPNEIERVS